MFADALEIVCAEGWYTEMLNEKCRSLLALDISPTALHRAHRRRAWHETVAFRQFDLRRDPMPGSFDLIVVASVLEYFSRPATFRRVREKLAHSLRPGGYLMVETTRSIDTAMDGCWWRGWLLQGKAINTFIAQHPALSEIGAAESDWYVITVYRKNVEDRPAGNYVTGRAPNPPVQS